MIKIICVGKIKEQYLRSAISEYEKRLKKFTKLEIIEVNDESNGNILEKEKNHIIINITKINNSTLSRNPL